MSIANEILADQALRPGSIVVFFWNDNYPWAKVVTICMGATIGKLSAELSNADSSNQKQADLIEKLALLIATLHEMLQDTCSGTVGEALEIGEDKIKVSCYGSKEDPTKFETKWLPKSQPIGVLGSTGPPAWN